jgi:hypothetical protein
VFSGEATNTNFIVFGLQLPGLESTIYHTQGEHANHHATDAVSNVYVELINMFKLINFKSGCKGKSCKPKTIKLVFVASPLSTQKTCNIAQKVQGSCI